MTAITLHPGITQAAFYCLHLFSTGLMVTESLSTEMGN
jgi:hypothetical protein